MSNANYASLGLTKDASPNDVKKAYRKLAMIHHPNKGGEPAMFTKIGAAFAAIKTAPPAKNNGQRTRVAGNITAFKAKVIDNFFRKNRPAKLVPGPGNMTTLAVVPANVKTNQPVLALTNVQGEPHKVIEAPNAVHEALVNGQITKPQLRLTGGNRQIVPYVPPNVRPVRVNTGTNAGPARVNTGTNAGPARVNIGPPGAAPRRSFFNRFSGLFGRRAPAPVKQERNARNMGTGTNAKNMSTGTNAKNMGTGTNNGPKNMSTGTNNGPKNMSTGTNAKNMGNNGLKNMGNNGLKNMGNNGGRGNVRTGNTRIGNVKSTSGSSRVEGVRGGSSQSEGGRGGTGGSISFAPVIKVNVPQAAAQSAVQALPPQERLALTNAGGYNNAAAAVSNAGGPATVERAINALNANGGNVNAAMQKTGLSRQVFNNVNKLGGPVTARRTLTAVRKVTMKTAPYVGQNATQRVAQNVYMGPNATRQNVYALAPVPVKKHRKKRMEVKLSELNRVINAVKKKKLTSLVAHNVTRTNIHANNARLKSYYKRVIKAAILKTPFAKIAREHAKKLVVSPRVKKPRRKTTNLSYA